MATADSGAGHDKPKCGAKKRQGEGCCRRPAGWGTDHPGVGRCKLHGGATVSHRDAAVEDLARKAVATYGLARDIPAIDALLEEVHWTAGHVAWLRERVAELEPDALVWGVTEESDQQATEFPGINTTRGAKPNVWLQLYREERKHLVDVTKAAISAGIEERRVKIAEAQGALLNGVIKRILARLDLTAAQSALLPVVVPEELRRAAAMASANLGVPRDGDGVRGRRRVVGVAGTGVA